MRKAVAATLTVLLLARTESLAETTDTPKRTLPHRGTCATPLPADFWEDAAARRFEKSESWAWHERICLGFSADMRDAPGGSGKDEVCASTVMEGKGEAVPAHRELRPEFLELVLSHEPWASVPRHPQVGFRCAVVRGNIKLDDHEIDPTVVFEHGKIEGDLSLVGSKLKRSLSLQGSTVTGKFKADRMEVGGGLLLRDGGTFSNIDLRRARIADDVAFHRSTVTGLLNADGLEVGGSLFLHDGGTFSDIDLLGARIAGQVAFNGSTVTGRLRADGLEVGDGLFLRDEGSFAEVRLLRARIGKTADFSGSTVTGLLNADGLEVGGSLFLHEGGKFAAVDLLGARIGGNVELEGSTVTGLLNADRLEIGGNLQLRGGSRFGGIDLIGARVAGDIGLDGSNVIGRLNASGLEAKGSLYLRVGTFADVDLIGAKIGADIQLSGGVFDGTLDLTGADIGGELHLSSGWLEQPPVWQNEAALVLRNASAGVLQARRDDWELSGGDGLVPTDLTGFSYNRLGGLDKTGGRSMGDESADWLVGWIEAQSDHGDKFDPQPYAQLARALETAGATGKAKAIRYAKFEHKLVHDGSVNPLQWVGLWLGKLVVGYGVYPFLALVWFTGIVLLGAALAQCSKQPSVRGWMGVWYSLENALPLIGTSERFKNVEHGRPGFDHIFLAQKFVGFALATVLVGALTLIGG